MSFLPISAVLANVTRAAKRLRASASIFSFIKPFAYPFASKPALSKRSLSGRSLIASIFMA
ncbi:MAG: hypothetical protein LBQ52_05305, partial [Helicobacteraceae bacterium]|nr:hypothetical protein [Helicobacteraceae bacterium]